MKFDIKKIRKILLLSGLMLFFLPKINAQINVGVSVGQPPPAMPFYVQPACPVDGYLWQPGYWAYDRNAGYYWVPGVWVAPPNPGLLWTPSYWGYEGGSYGFHLGYWGPSVGFYGGINYGLGYSGWGFAGGVWSGGHFRYNTAAVNVNRTIIHDTYIDRSVIHNTYANNRTSFNGPGGVTARPRPEELAAMKERHIQPTASQISHQQAASRDRSQFSSSNHGHPAAAAMDKVGGQAYNTKGGVSKPAVSGQAKATAKSSKTGAGGRTRLTASRRAPHSHNKAGKNKRHAIHANGKAAKAKQRASNVKQQKATANRRRFSGNHRVAKTRHEATARNPSRHQQPPQQHHNAPKAKSAELYKKV